MGNYYRQIIEFILKYYDIYILTNFECLIDYILIDFILIDSILCKEVCISINRTLYIVNGNMQIEFLQPSNKNVSSALQKPLNSAKYKYYTLLVNKVSL